MHIKRHKLKYIGAAIMLSVVLFAVFVASKTSPYLYTKFYGNPETEALYLAYRAAVEGQRLADLKKYIDDNNLHYIEQDSDGIITLHAKTPGHAETVVIRHDGSNTIGARFDDFP